MNIVRNSILCLVVVLIAGLALGQGTYTQIDVQGAIATSVSAVDSAGDVVGEYTDSTNTSHAFLLSGGVVTNIDYPGARRGTFVNGINDVGQIVGTALGVDFKLFVYDFQTQNFTTFSHIGCAQPYGTSINNAGAIVGYCYGENSTFGFELAGSSFMRIQPRGQFASEVWGISGAGMLVGFAQNLQGTLSTFLYSNDSYRKLVIPGAVDGEVNGISNAGTAFVGTKTDDCMECGFLYLGGNLQLLQFPGAISTVPSGVNDIGVVVGTFNDVNNESHGFIWTPPADAAKK